MMTSISLYIISNLLIEIMDAFARVCVVCARTRADGGGHPDGLCNHWLCSECQLDFPGPVYCPCGVDSFELVGAYDEGTDSETEEQEGANDEQDGTGGDDGDGVVAAAAA